VDTEEVLSFWDKRIEIASVLLAKPDQHFASTGDFSALFRLKLIQSSG